MRKMGVDVEQVLSSVPMTDATDEAGLEIDLEESKAAVTGLAAGSVSDHLAHLGAFNRRADLMQYLEDLEADVLALEEQRGGASNAAGDAASGEAAAASSAAEASAAGTAQASSSSSSSSAIAPARVAALSTDSTSSFQPLPSPGRGRLQVSAASRFSSRALIDATEGLPAVSEVPEDEEALDSALMDATRAYMRCQDALSARKDEQARVASNREAQQQTMRLLGKVERAQAARSEAEAAGRRYEETDHQLIGLDPSTLPERGQLEQQMERAAQDAATLEEDIAALQAQLKQLSLRQQQLQRRRDAL